MPIDKSEEKQFAREELSDEILKKADNLADAVRVLLYGNGDLLSCVEDVKTALAACDDVPTKSSRLTGAILKLSMQQDYGYNYYSGNDWNKTLHYYRNSTKKAYCGVEVKRGESTSNFNTTNCESCKAAYLNKENDDESD